MTIRFVGALSILLVLGACSTPYGKMGFRGGVAATQVDADTVRVSARGNAFTSTAAIRNYVLLKAADETKELGYDYFAVISDSDASHKGTISFATANAYGNRWGIWGNASGFSEEMIKPGEDALVKMYHGQKPADAPPNVFDASEIIRYLGRTVKGYKPPPGVTLGQSQIAMDSSSENADEPLGTAESSGDDGPPPSVASPSLTSSQALSPHAVRMKRHGGTYVVPVAINNAITLDFEVDSGASDVVIPGDVLLTLIRTGTVDKNDSIGGQKNFQLADGSTFPSTTFRIHSLRVGDVTLSNVTAAVVPDPRASLLLGQSFLGRFGSWSIDNRSHTLVLNAGGPAPDSNARLANVAPRPRPAAAPSLGEATTVAYVPPSASAKPVPAGPQNASPGPHLSVADGTAALMRRDYATALAAYKPLAEQGNPLAENGLGFLYAHGDGVAQDSKLAAQWFRKAVAQGSYEAGTNLGWMYESGDGASRDLVRAYMWYAIALATSSGDSRVAQTRIDTVSKAMSESDIAKAKQLADTCQKSNFETCGE